ncbi:uncharacterized protein LOC113390950 [Ctenocephalides felis]|uniref:uncharacterized protein LOC113390950 n=1 Tax=Ctenocephalides felis TaxID=7515 RepID=UPI000E6E298A|nr:uncharacterized protein LOC113390950 [Ctenocephalides felis]
MASNTGVQTLLSTVSLTVIDAGGAQHTVRALLDSESQINLITNSLLAKLKCSINSEVHRLSVLQGQSFLCNKAVKLTVKSRIGAFSRNINCVVVDRITPALPSVFIDYEGRKIPDNVSLADPSFNVPSNVDMLIGVELYFDVLQQGCIRLGNHLPISRKSSFGWLISGVFKAELQGNVHVGLVSNEDFHNSSTKFWQLEETSSNNAMTGSDKQCEDHFMANVTRLENGQFEVALPFVEDQVEKLGSSFVTAKHRFLNLERRFARDVSHAGQIVLTPEEAVGSDYYFLPHHPVVKDGNFSKIRVVFDASAKSSTGISLDNILHTGPKLHYHRSKHFGRLVRIQEEIVRLLGEGDFSLHKWSSNCREVLRAIPEKNRSSTAALFSEGDTVKNLVLA